MPSTSQHVEIAKAMHGRIALIMVSPEETQTLTLETLDIIKLALKKHEL